MRDQQCGGRALQPDALQLQVHAAAQDLVKRAKRLVEQEHIGLGHQRPRDGHPLAHTTRQLGGQRLLETPQTDQFDQGPDTLAVGGSGAASDVQR